VCVCVCVCVCACVCVYVFMWECMWRLAKYSPSVCVCVWLITFVRRLLCDVSARPCISLSLYLC